MQPSSTELPILSVSQLTQAIKHCLESTFRQVCLQGEISNCKLQSSGHLYFSLKDSSSQISAVMFRGDALLLKLIPKDGAQVIVKGELNVYPPSGKYQLIVREMTLVGIGELLVKLEELKIKLRDKGWFRAEHKKPLPFLPKKIGVVTSPTGAAIQDILNILTRRFSGFHLILNPVRVQGEGAAQEIAQAIRYFNTHNLVDVMIVGRGGGSIEDLWAFNEEIVADAIFHSRIPIISAVGHETDHCIADYVADVRAPTPSAAAEIVMAEKTHQIHHLSQIQKRLQQCASHLIRHAKQQLKGICRHPIFSSPYTVLGLKMQKLDDLRQELDRQMLLKLSNARHQLASREKLLESVKPSAQIRHLRQKLNMWNRALLNAWEGKQRHRRHLFSAEIKYRQLDQIWQRSQQSRKERLLRIIEMLGTIDPKNLLSKGYCILFSEKDNSVITSIRSVTKQQNIRVLLSDGQLSSTVNNILPK